MCWYLSQPKCSNHKDTCIVLLCRYVCTYKPLQQCIPTSSASTSATHAPVIYQAPINVPLPTYDWNVADGCMSLDCSSTSLILGSHVARSRLRNTWTTYSPSWARKGTQLWTVGSQLMKPTNKIQRNSLIILRAPWMMRYPPELEFMSLRISKRGLMYQLMNS